MAADSDRKSPDLRDLLLKEARAILDEPETALDLRKVAERAGKSRTAPYLVFGKTEDGGGLAALRLAVAADGFRELAGALAEACDSTDDPEEGIHGMASAYLDFAHRNPRLFRLMFGAEVAHELERAAATEPARAEHAELRRAREAIERIIVLAIERQAEGYLRRAGAFGSRIVAGALLAMLHGTAMLTIDRQWEVAGFGASEDPEELARQVLTVLTTASTRSLRDAAQSLVEAQIKRAQGLFDAGPAVSASDSGVAEVGPAPERYMSSARFEGDVHAPESDVDEVDDSDGTLESDETDDTDGNEGDAGAADAARRRKRGVGPREGSRRSFREREYSMEAPPPLHERAPEYRRHAHPDPHDDAARELTQRSSALRRARGVIDAVRGARILWIDDHPELSTAERKVLEGLGAEVVTVKETAGALRLLKGASFDAVISDIDREGHRSMGIRALPLLRNVAPDTAVVFYIARVSADLGHPTGAFGITDDPEELLHLVLDAVERRRM